MQYNWNNPANALEMVKSRVLDVASKEEKWYRVARRYHSGFSRLIRACTILLFTLGALFPMLNISIGNDEINAANDSFNFGYLFLALGGLLVLLDKYLGVSTGYVRFFIAELEIKRQTAEFIDNWDLELAKLSGQVDPGSILTLLNLVKQLRHAVFAAIQSETVEWTAEFSSQTGELYQLFKQKESEVKVSKGSISVIVEEANKYKNIEYFLNGNGPNLLDAVSSTILIRDVPVGVYEVKVKGSNSKDVVVGATANVLVEAGKMIELNMKLSESESI